MEKTLETNLDYTRLVSILGIQQLDILRKFSVNCTPYEILVLRICFFITSCFYNELLSKSYKNSDSCTAEVFLTVSDSVCIGNPNTSKEELFLYDLDCKSAELKKAFDDSITLLKAYKEFGISEISDECHAIVGYSITLPTKKS